jgi:hypothetical protein
MPATPIGGLGEPSGNHGMVRANLMATRARPGFTPGAAFAIATGRIRSLAPVTKCVRRRDVIAGE